MKNLFPDTVMDNILDTNSSFHVKQGTTRKAQFQFKTLTTKLGALYDFFYLLLLLLLPEHILAEFCPTD